VSLTVTVDRVGDVVHAREYTDDPSAGGLLLTEEWVQASTHTARSEDSDAIETRVRTMCGASPCDDFRTVTRLRDTDPNAQEAFTRYTGSPGDPNLPEAATILTPATASPSGQGNLRSIAAPWQRMPPAAGQTYSRFDVTDEQDGANGTFVTYVPVTLTANAARTYALDGGVPGSLAGAAAWIIGLLAIFIPVCVWRYRRMS
jgi:hypothetical protein